MPRNDLWSSLASKGRNKDEDDEDHAVPLLPNQEPSGLDEFHPPTPRAYSSQYSRLLAECYSDVACYYHNHRTSLLSLLFAIVFSLVFIKLVFGNASSPKDPNVFELTPAYFTDLGSRRVRIKYGPYNVPMSSVDNGMAHFLERNSIKPCEDCLITYIKAGLEYPNGAYANADSGLWLHHIVQLDTAVDDAVCGKDVTNQPLAPNRFFASGNERSAVHMSAQGTQRTGYFVGKDSTIVTSIELMNETPKNLSAVITVDYEFIQANPFPPSFQNLTSIWLDVGGCRSSDVPAQPKTRFTLDTPTSWIVPGNLFLQNIGRIIFAEGHLHDGGTHLEIRRNENGIICNSNATYGATPGFIDHKMEHISNMTSCGVDKPSIEDNIVRSGDKFDLSAHYDMISHQGMLEADGTEAPVMGIAIIYMAPGDATS